MRRKKNNPQTMLLGEYSVRTGKTPQQKHINHRHTTIATGEVIQLHQAAVRTRSHSRRWPQTRLSGGCYIIQELVLPTTPSGRPALILSDGEHTCVSQTKLLSA